MFGKRLVSAVVLLSITGVALVLGGYWLWMLCLVAATLGCYEIMDLSGHRKNSLGVFTITAALFYYLINLLEESSYNILYLLFCMVVLTGIFVFTYPQYQLKDVLIGSITLFYIPVMLCYAYMLRELPYGNWGIWLILIGASGTDTFAYLCGKLFGKHHFSELSPKKTIEGCIGGVLGTTCMFLLYAHLCASAIKRHYDVKDFSHIIPGHGGVMDRLDSIVFVAPFAYYGMLFLVR